MALKNVLGQDRAINILLATLRRGRVPSAYLFAGEAGIGKKFTALNLAKAINCENRVGSQQSAVGSQDKYSELIDSCDTCGPCRKIDAGMHPDVMLLSPEKNEIIIDEIRAIEDALSLKPYEGRRKVVIVDNADTMNQHAANAFLKTLEEPPDHSLLVLIASRPDRLPETIRSRCSRVNFLPLPDELCKHVIRTAGHGVIDENRLDALVRLVMGSPGTAITTEVLSERDSFIELLKRMLSGSNQSWADRDEMEQWLNSALMFMRDMAVLKTADKSSSEGRGSRLFNEDIKGFVAETARRTDFKGIIDAYYKIAELLRLLDFNINKAVAWNYTAVVVNAAVSGRK